MPRPATPFATGIACAVLLATTACGSAVSGATAAPDVPPAFSPPASPSVTPSAPQAEPTTSAGASPSTSATSGPDPVFRALRGSFEGVRVTAEVYPVRRSSATSTATVRFVVAKGTATFRIREALNDHNPEVGDKGTTSPDGLRLIDAEAKRAYLPATIGDRECLCSPSRNGLTDHYTDVTVSVTFAAPPAGRDTISLLVPRFGTVSDVPIR